MLLECLDDGKIVRVVQVLADTGATFPCAVTSTPSLPILSATHQAPEGRPGPLTAAKIDCGDIFEDLVAIASC